MIFLTKYDCILLDMKQEFHLNLKNVKRENVRRTSILMNNSCIPSYVVCD